MPNPIAAPASLIGASTGGVRHFEVRSSDGARYSWSSPPLVLNRLLGDLFADQPEDVLSWVHLAVWQMRGEDLFDSKDRKAPFQTLLSTKSSSTQASRIASSSSDDIKVSLGQKRFRSLFMQLAANSSPTTSVQTGRIANSGNGLMAHINSKDMVQEDSVTLGDDDTGDAFVLRVNKQRVGYKTPSARSLKHWDPRSHNRPMESVPEHAEESDDIATEFAEFACDSQTFVFEASDSKQGAMGQDSMTATNSQSESQRFSMNTMANLSMTNRRSDSQDVLTLHKAAAKRAASNLSWLSDIQSSTPSSMMQDVFQDQFESSFERKANSVSSVTKSRGDESQSRGTSFMSSLTKKVVTAGGRFGLRVNIFNGSWRKTNSSDLSRKANSTARSTRRNSQTSEASDADVGEQSWLDNFVYPSARFSSEVGSEGLPMPEYFCEALLPSARRQLLWDLVFSVCLIFDAWATPFVLTYLPDPSALPQWLDVLFTTIFVIFCIDIVHNCFVGYIRNSVVVLSLWEASLHYLMTWFTVDVVATLPHLIWICSKDGHPGIRWMSLLRLLRLMRVHQFMRRLPAMLELSWQVECFLRFLHFQGLVTVVAHFNAVCWAAVQPKSWVAVDTQEALRHYLWCLWRALSILTCSGDAPVSDQEAEWSLSILISLERSILFFTIVSYLAWEQIKHIGHYDFAQNAVQEKLLAYVRRARVPVPLQMELSRWLKVNSKVRSQQLHFDALVEQELPRHLRANLCRELWGYRLMSFSLLHEIMKWNAELAQELVMMVRDMYFAPNVKIYSAGEVSNAAYLVLSGKLASSDSSTIDWSPGMWVGEKAIVNPELRRSETVFTKERSELMGVPANDVRKLLITFDVLSRFEGLLQKKLWKGLCGRCGSLGDHFESECPMLSRKSWPLPPLQRLPGSRRTREGSVKSSHAKTSEGFEKEFADFIEQHDMGHLRKLFLKYNVQSLDDVTRDVVEKMVLDKEYQLSELEAGVMYDAAAKFKKKLKRSCTQLLSNSMSNSVDSGHHLIFISHSKSEAGTEAALIQKDLDKLLCEDPNFSDLTSPVFLDTEDLRDLSELQAHVERSHNLLLLLTQNVLTRPWVLVEIVTACRVDTKIVLVEIQRRDVTYNFPREEFFQSLEGGTELDLGAYGLLKDQNISLEELVTTLRQVFQRIALPFSPHKTANVRQAELMDILKNCKMIDKMVLSPQRQGGNNAHQLSRQGTKTDLFGSTKTNAPH